MHVAFEEVVSTLRCQIPTLVPFGMKIDNTLT